jgi:2-dehydro-3-deoxygluconokinase
MDESGAQRVVAIGETMLRLAPPVGERLETANALRVSVGGAESNALVALAALGVPTSWIGALPRNPLGRRIARSLRAAGVDLSAVLWVEQSRLGLYFVELGSPPRPDTVFYDRAASAITIVAAEEYDFSALESARYALFSGIVPALRPRGEELAGEFMKSATAQDVPICFDVNYRERLWGPDTAATSLRRFAEASDVLVCSERDAARLFGLAGEAEAVVSSLREEVAPQAELVVVTLAERGCIALSASGELIAERAYNVPVVDRFGTGDAFLAGLLWGLMGGSLHFALRTANAVAAIKASTFGDHFVGTAEDVYATIEGEKLGVVR